MPIKPSDEEDRYFQAEGEAALHKFKKELERKTTEELTKEAQQEAIANLGFTEDTVRILDLTPLVQMAWADGSVSDQEKELIDRVMEKRGVKKGDRAYDLMHEFLNRRPTDAFFDAAITLIKKMYDALPENKKGRAEKDLVEFCVEVADASGGIFGFNRIESDERKELKKIIESLGAQKTDDLQKLLKGV